VVEGIGDHGCEYMTGGRVVVIGGTGRNFAAGMSGGIAYVLDEAGGFRAPGKTGLGDLEPLVGGGGGGRGKGPLSRHIPYTQSPVAARLLVHWEATRERFVKIMPRDYKRVLQAIKKAEETGMSVDDVVMASAHG